MESGQVHQTIGMITPDGDMTKTSIITSAPNDGSGHNSSKSFVVDHIYGMTAAVASPASSVGSILHATGQSGPSSLCSSPTVPSMRGRSKVWNEFSRTADGKKVSCHRCGDFLAYSNSHSTSSMLKHLKRKHGLDLYPSINGNVNDNSSSEYTGAESSSSGNQTDSKFRSSGQFEKRIRSGSTASATNGKSMKGQIPKEEEELANTSIQHGPLLFKDPCVRMKWTDHSDTFLRTFSSLYSDENYTDVTLVAEKHFFKAHRVILSSASEFFDESFKMTPAGQHPIIFLKDVKALEFRILLDFIYKGEVAIPPSLIPGLVKVGSELRVRGLSDFVWNEQLANSVFQAKPQQQQQQQSCSSSVVENRRFIQQTQATFPSQLIRNSSIPLSSPSSLTPVRMMTSPVCIRQPVVQQQQQQLVTNNDNTLGQHQQAGLLSSQPTRMYSRIVNIRPTNPSGTVVGDGGVVGGDTSTNGVLSSNGFQGQIISGDLSTVCSSFPGMKRIRIVKSESRLSSVPSSQLRQVTGGPCKPVENAGGGNSELLSVHGQAATTTPTQQPDTVLMVTNEGQTLLSTTQGGVTVLTQPSSMAAMGAMTLPLNPQQDSNVGGTQQQQQQLRPVITAVTSQALPQQQQLLLQNSSGTAAERELDEVVYSITEIPDDDETEGGEQLESLPQDQEMTCGDDDEPSDNAGDVDKKPFLQE